MLRHTIIDLTKIEHRGIIKFLCKEDAAPNKTTNTWWPCTEKVHLYTLYSPNWPNQTVTQVNRIITEDLCFTVVEIPAVLVDLSVTFHHLLRICGACPRSQQDGSSKTFVLKTLQQCHELLKLVNTDPADFITRLLTGDETCLSPLGS